MTRERLPDRRDSTILTINGLHDKLHVGFTPFADGRLAEIFATGGKPGSDYRIAVLEAITATSFALQYGARPEEILKALPRDGERPEGDLGLILEAWIAMTRPKDRDPELPL